MFTLTLSLKEVAHLIMQNYGYNDEDSKDVHVIIKQEYGTTYVHIEDRNLTVGPEEIPSESQAESLSL